jgi:hypothetical protein
VNERDLRDAIAVQLLARGVIETGLIPVGGGTWPEMTLLATVAVLREWGIDPMVDDVTEVFIPAAANVAIDRLIPRLPKEVEERVLDSLPPDRPSRGGPGSVRYAAERGFSNVRRCPNCRTPLYRVSKSQAAIAQGVPGQLWITIEGRAGQGADGVIDIRPAPTVDRAGAPPGYVDGDGVAWPLRDMETPYRPPILVRCHGGSQALPKGDRGGERCGAVVRVDEVGTPSLVSG